MTSGMQAMQQAITEGQRKADAARGAAAGRNIQYINWKNGDKKIIRFLADDYETQWIHEFILDKSGTTKNFMVDPADPDRLLRYVSPSPGIGWQRKPNGPIVKPQAPGPNVKGDGAPRQISMAIAVLRQEVQRDGKLVIEDYFYDKDVEGTAMPARYFGVVQQSLNNFWKTLAVSCYNRYGTLCDRDYEITRTGEGFDTAYSIIPLPAVEELTDVELVKKLYGYGEPWDEKDPNRFLKCPTTTKEYVAYYSGEDRYKFWLTADGAATATATTTPSGMDEYHPDTTHNDEAQANAPVSAPTSGTNFATLQEQLIAAAKSK
jgi:hypothetical protein